STRAAGQRPCPSLRCRCPPPFSFHHVCCALLTGAAVAQGRSLGCGPAPSSLFDRASTEKATMKTIKNIIELNDKDTTIPAAYFEALLSLTRRPVAIDADTAIGHFTQFRHLELSKTNDNSVSAWTAGGILIAGRQVEVTVFLGDLQAPTEVERAMRRAKATIAEVISNGSSAATFLGEGTTRAGHRAFAYAAPGLDLKFATTRFAEYVARKGIAVEDAKVEVKPTIKKSAKV